MWPGTDFPLSLLFKQLLFIGPTVTCAYQLRSAEKCSTFFCFVSTRAEMLRGFHRF